MERKILDKIISEIRKWNDGFNIHQTVDSYFRQKENSPDNRAIRDCKVNIESFLVNGEFIETKEDLRICNFIRQNGFDLWNCGTIKAYEELLLKQKDEVLTSGKIIMEEYSLETENKQHNLANLKLSISINKWLLKTKWWPLSISMATLLFSIYVWKINRSNEGKQQKQIEILQSKLQETRNEILYKVDSLYRKEHILDTSKRR